MIKTTPTAEYIHPVSQHKLFGLDHLRALAILLVLGFHYQLIFPHPRWTECFLQMGWTGVDLFFVLSGFLISSQLFAQIRKGRGVSLKTFYLKRFFRILPIYFFIVAVYFLFPFFREKEALSPLWKFLTFTLNFGLDLKHFGTFSHAWSLCVEEHFYLFFPLILIFLLRRNRFVKSYWIILALILFGILLRMYLWHVYYTSNGEMIGSLSYWTKHIYYPTYNRLDGLLVGVSIAALREFLPAVWGRISKFGNLFIIGSMVLLVVIYFYFSDMGTYATSVWGFALIAIAYGFLVCGAVSPSCFLYNWNSRITTFIAILSYGIYLSHKGVIHMTQYGLTRLDVKADSNLMLLACITACVMVAWLLNLTIEKPFMKMRDRVIGQKRKPMGAQ